MLKSISQTRLDNVKRLMIERDVTRADIETKAEINPSQLSQYFSGHKVIGDNIAGRIEHAFGLPRYWLDQTYFEGDSNDTTTVKRVRSVPVLSWVQAGVFAQTGDMEYDTTAPLYDDSYPDDVYWLTVKGNSMEPRFSQGDLLLIDPSRQATGGDFVIACEIDTGSITFKRLRIGFDESTGQDYYQLVPLNDNYAVIDSRYKDFEIQGVVVERKEILI